MSLFFELLQIAIGTRKRLSYILTSKDREIAYQQALEQTVVGVCFYGLELVYQQQPEAIANLPQSDNIGESVPL